MRARANRGANEPTSELRSAVDIDGMEYRQSKRKDLWPRRAASSIPCLNSRFARCALSVPIALTRTAPSSTLIGPLPAGRIMSASRCKYPAMLRSRRSRDGGEPRRLPYRFADIGNIYRISVSVGLGIFGVCAGTRIIRASAADPPLPLSPPGLVQVEAQVADRHEAACARRLYLYSLRYRNALTGKWINARYVADWHEIAARRSRRITPLDAAQASLRGQRNHDAAGYDFVNGLLGLLERFAADMLNAVRRRLVDVHDYLVTDFVDQAFWNVDGGHNFPCATAATDENGSAEAAMRDVSHHP